MIKSFPHFEKLSLKHKTVIDRFIRQFPPYSDFTFTSLYTYNTREIIELSILHENLVVKFQDYLHQQPFYSFIGTRQLVKTADILLNLSSKKKIKAELKLIPEIIVNKQISQQFQIIEDPNNHDYIVSAEELSTLTHKKHEKKRDIVNRFHKQYPHHRIRQLDFNDKKTTHQMFELFYQWQINSGHSKSEIKIELKAFSRLFHLINKMRIYGTGVYLNNQLVGFTTYETVHHGYGMSLFEKANRTIKDLYTVVCHTGAKHMFQLGCRHINFEQDLGLEGLRYSKSLWKPTHFLKKYIIKPR